MTTAPAGSRRVAITGLGVIAPAGLGKREFWNGLLGPGAAYGQSLEIEDWDPTPYFDSPKSARRADRVEQFALAAAAEAFEQAGGLEAIGVEADPKAMEFSAAVMVDAKWLTPNKLEVEIMCKLSDIVSELESKFSSLDLSVVKGLEQDKGVTAKGTGDLKHEKGGTRHARPGEMSRQAAEEGGGLVP